jgi:hypothetical protein
MKVRAGEKRPRKIKQTNGQESDEKKQPILWT